MVQIFDAFFYSYVNFQNWAEQLLCSASVMQEIGEILSYFALGFFSSFNRAAY